MSVEMTDTAKQEKNIWAEIGSEIVGFGLFLGMFAGISMYLGESLFFALGIGPTALLAQIARKFERFTLGWWTTWSLSTLWLGFSFFNIEMFLPG